MKADQFQSISNSVLTYWACKNITTRNWIAFFIKYWCPSIVNTLTNITRGFAPAEYRIKIRALCKHSFPQILQELIVVVEFLKRFPKLLKRAVNFHPIIKTAQQNLVCLVKSSQRCDVGIVFL